ncbi:MAG TPA: ATP-dependent DNA helicase RecG [Candidatus Brocadiia bacterium]|nr:ATP-dependent DNA helicase RecG [Planctomycetota bacterium]MDO8093467.1 ATP-dependent DNA helicase RecG [Candidatus Brocadiales bacterium]
MDNNESLLKNVQYLKGVGPRRFALLKRLGIQTIYDLLYYFPRDYQDRSNILNISNIPVNTVATVKGRVIDINSYYARSGKHVLEVYLNDNTGTVQGIWFNQPFLKKKFHVGDEFIFYGRVRFYKCLQIANPEFELITDDPLMNEGIVPIYPLTEYLTQALFRNLTKNAVDEYVGSVKEMLDEEFLAKRQLCSVTDALKNIHFPESLEHLKMARRRLSYDEFFLLEVAMALRRRGIKEGTGYAFKIGQNVESHILRLFPFSLTNGQKWVIGEIRDDMRSEKPMNRLLQGDVGSGKTAVAIYALLAAIANGFQTALMAPTEILAEQHYQTLLRYLSHARVKILLLTGGSPTAMRKENIGKINHGEIDLVVGTHALIMKDVKFKKLGLVVVDEQHKFGVIQRANLRMKGCRPDVLVMTATPIPRTLSLTIFGDLDISILNEIPPGRTPVETRLHSEKHLAEAYEFIRNELNQGRQAFVIYPLVKESEKLDLKSATEGAKKLQDIVFPKFKVGLLHGQMKQQDKDRIMKDFRERRYDILVSTIVIEVGIDVPNATIMVIEHAERFGLAQLHQLRGRIGRGPHKSYCLLFGNPRTPEARKRLQIMTQTNDGFRIAEEDLQIRGPGEFFGTRQHGLPELKIGDLIGDYPLLKLARDDAFSIVKNDGRLEQEKNRFIKETVIERFKGRLNLISIG